MPGPAPVEEVAVQIATAAGASGPNYDYLHNLADAMRGLGRAVQVDPIKSKLKPAWN
jgi:cation transport regulator ChaC